jgi:hypothetical protein
LTWTNLWKDGLIDFVCACVWHTILYLQKYKMTFLTFYFHSGMRIIFYLKMRNIHITREPVWSFLGNRHFAAVAYFGAHISTEYLSVWRYSKSKILTFWLSLLSFASSLSSCILSVQWLCSWNIFHNSTISIRQECRC